MTLSALLFTKCGLATVVSGRPRRECDVQHAITLLRRRELIRHDVRESESVR